MLRGISRRASSAFVVHDGTDGEVDLAELVDGPIFDPLRDASYFKRFSNRGPHIGLGERRRLCAGVFAWPCACGTVRIEGSLGKVILERDDMSRFEFLDYKRFLFVSLDRPAFEQVLKAVQENSAISDVAEIEANEVSEILIYDESRHDNKSSARWNWWKDCLSLWGAGLLLFVVIFFCLIGIIAIFGIIPLP
jgi:hypothetical protein